MSDLRSVPAGVLGPVASIPTAWRAGGGAESFIIDLDATLVMTKADK